MALKQARLQRQTQARIPTIYGEFQLYLYSAGPGANQHLALVRGDVAGATPVLARVHSECFTGDVLGSQRCDCRDQLHQALARIGQEGRGVLIYLRQEGRGIGLLDKLRAYNLQDQGYDTVDANLLLGHPADARDYTAAHDIFQDLGVQAVHLLTNNPAKVENLSRLGTTVAGRIPLPPRIHPENRRYLEAKRQRLQHWLDVDGLLNGAGAPARQRPTITLSYAQSLDGCLTTQRGEPLALSGEASRQLTHQLRAEHDALLVGVGTIVADNPALTVRYAAGPHPQPVVLDSWLRCPPTAQVVARGAWLITGLEADPERQARLEAAGATVLRAPIRPDGWISLPEALQLLAQLGVRSLMVEGGAQVLTSCLLDQVADRAVITIAPVYVGGLHAVEKRLPLPRLHQVHTWQLGEDTIIAGELH